MTKANVRDTHCFQPIECSLLVAGYIEMEDLLASFHDPCIMDCKIGVRTYLEEDLEKSERDPEPRAVGRTSPPSAFLRSSRPLGFVRENDRH